MIGTLDQDLFLHIPSDYPRRSFKLGYDVSSLSTPSFDHLSDRDGTGGTVRSGQREEQKVDQHYGSRVSIELS